MQFVRILSLVRRGNFKQLKQPQSVMFYVTTSHYVPMDIPKVDPLTPRQIANACIQMHRQRSLRCLQPFLPARQTQLSSQLSSQLPNQLLQPILQRPSLPSRQQPRHRHRHYRPPLLSRLKVQVILQLLNQLCRQRLLSLPLPRRHNQRPPHRHLLRRLPPNRVQMAASAVDSRTYITMAMTGICGG